MFWICPFFVLFFFWGCVLIRSRMGIKFHQTCRNVCKFFLGSCWSYYFPQQVSVNKGMDFLFFFCALVIFIIVACTYTPWCRGSGTRMTQASFLNCGGRAIVPAIGSALPLYSERFRFLTAQQCLINPGAGGTWMQGTDCSTKEGNLGRGCG